MRDAITVAKSYLMPVDVHDLATMLSHHDLVANRDDIARDDEHAGNNTFYQVL